uniref:Probable GTP-binding protein EngB n=1 Tax=Candidatus Kentrum sp. TUN TaxID=2126343 RepID=A0A451AMQ8_9GAMM|nr:MAG: GTP-binding protein [Candidatus Kentron sp. TUN]VFK61759.1 MAG: GTP-binding protein [Candidatus Kentron sp. TUN]VFK67319.1 MAG: GTP-binding protein [Candidatus Kentron sp. TUN]
MFKKDKTKSLYERAVFLRGAVRYSQFPPDQGGEVAFAGRSNVGKSSAINIITGIRALARTSKIPGRTQQINFFQLDEKRRLVDLPGYGYAKVPEKIRRTWAVMVGDYLQRRQSLQGVILLMDVRRPLTTLDCQLVDWCHTANLPFHVVLTKSDKLSRTNTQTIRRETFRRLSILGNDVDVILFSATQKQGVDEVREYLDKWLDSFSIISDIP